MKYISLDIETTGLDKNRCDILQVAVVIDDLSSPLEELPRFVAFVKHENLRFEPYALGMHIKSGLMARYLADREKASLDATFAKLLHFLDRHYPLATSKDKYILAGKNLAGFDLPFIATANAGWSTRPYLGGIDDAGTNTHQFLARHSHRIIDPGTSFTDFFSDSTVADLKTCKERAGIDNGPVAHDAMDDALDVVRVVRRIAKINCQWQADEQHKSIVS